VIGEEEMMSIDWWRVHPIDPERYLTFFLSMFCTTYLLSSSKPTTMASDAIPAKSLEMLDKDQDGFIHAKELVPEVMRLVKPDFTQEELNRAILEVGGWERDR